MWFFRSTGSQRAPLNSGKGREGRTGFVATFIPFCLYFGCVGSESSFYWNIPQLTSLGGPSCRGRCCRGRGRCGRGRLGLGGGCHRSTCCMCFFALPSLLAPPPHPSSCLCKCGRICKHNHATCGAERSKAWERERVGPGEWRGGRGVGREAASGFGLS